MGVAAIAEAIDSCSVACCDCSVFDAALFQQKQLESESLLKGQDTAKGSGGKSVKRRFVKCVLQGCQKVGKTCVYRQFAKNKFHARYKATNVADFTTKSLMLNDRMNDEEIHCDLQLWDCPSVKKSPGSLLRGTQVVCLVYSLKSRKSFDLLKTRIIPRFQAQCSGDRHESVAFLIGTHLDECVQSDLDLLVQRESMLGNGSAMGTGSSAAWDTRSQSTFMTDDDLISIATSVRSGRMSAESSSEDDDIILGVSVSGKRKSTNSSQGTRSVSSIKSGKREMLDEKDLSKQRSGNKKLSRAQVSEDMMDELVRQNSPWIADHFEISCKDTRMVCAMIDKMVAVYIEKEMKSEREAMQRMRAAHRAAAARGTTCSVHNHHHHPHQQQSQSSLMMGNHNNNNGGVISVSALPSTIGSAIGDTYAHIQQSFAATLGHGDPQPYSEYELSTKESLLSDSHRGRLHTGGGLTSGGPRLPPARYGAIPDSEL